jgi:hypothetical protein
MHAPRTCVILVNYRGASDTAACVRSLLASACEAVLVVVDSTPDDPGLEPALAFAPGIQLIRAPENLGFGGANNLGIAWALRNTECEFFFLLNNDTTVRPDTIALLIAACERDPGIGIAVPRIAYMHDPGRLWYGGGEIDWRRASAVAPGFNGSANAPLAMTERDVTFATGCALFLRRAALAQLKGFDPRFFMYEEDCELCLRASECGIRIRYIPSAFILHRAQGSNRQSAHLRTDFWSTANPRLPFLCYHVIRNRLLNISLHARGKNLGLVAGFFPLFLIRRAVPFLIHGRCDAIVAMARGVADFVLERYCKSKTRIPVAAYGQTKMPG